MWLLSDATMIQYWFLHEITLDEAIDIAFQQM